MLVPSEPSNTALLTDTYTRRSASARCGRTRTLVVTTQRSPMERYDPEQALYPRFGSLR